MFPISNVHLLQNIFGARKHHNLSLLSTYEIMSLADLTMKFFQVGNLKTKHFKRHYEILRRRTFAKKPFKFQGFFCKVYFSKNAPDFHVDRIKKFGA